MIWESTDTNLPSKPTAKSPRKKKEQSWDTSVSRRLLIAGRQKSPMLNIGKGKCNAKTVSNHITAGSTRTTPFCFERQGLLTELL